MNVLWRIETCTDQRKHQSSASLAFVWGIHRDRWIPRTNGQLRGKCFHLMTSSCVIFHCPSRNCELCLLCSSNTCSIWSLNFKVTFISLIHSSLNQYCLWANVFVMYIWQKCLILSHVLLATGLPQCWKYTFWGLVSRGYLTLWFYERLSYGCLSCGDTHTHTTHAHTKLNCTNTTGCLLLRHHGKNNRHPILFI